MKYKLHKKHTKKVWGRRAIAGVLLIGLVGGIVSTTFINPAKAAADIAVVSSSTALGGTATTSQVVNAPAGVVSGNVLLAQTIALPGTGNTVTTSAPSGWVKIGTAITSNKYSMTEFYKVATGAEPSTYTFTFSAAATKAIGITAFSGVDNTNPIDVQSTQINTSSTTQTAPSVSATYNTDMIVPLWGYQSNQSATSFSATLTSLYATSTTSNGISSAWKLLTNAGATGTFTTTTTAATASLAHTIGLKPAAAAVGVQFKAVNTPALCTTTCTSLAANVPTGTTTGYFLLANISWSTTGTLTSPGGWTQVSTTQVTGTTSSANMYHFVAIGDATSYTWSFSNATLASVNISSFTGVDDVTPIDVNAQLTDTTGTSHSSPSVTTVYPQDMLVDIWSFNTGTNATTITASMTKAWDNQTGNASTNVSSVMGYELIGLAGATGTRNVTSGRNSIAVMHSIALKAYLPTPSLLSPVSGITGLTLFPTFSLVNASLTATPLKYKIQLCSTATCSVIITTYDQTVSQTGWTGQDALTGTAYVGSTTESGSTKAFYTVQTALTPGTQYWWRGLSFDTGSSQLSNTSTIYTFTTSGTPTAPTLFAPLNSAAGISVRPEFQLASTDVDSDLLKYKIELCSTNTCSTILQTFTQSSSQINWSGQDDTSASYYTSDPATVANSARAYYSINTGGLTANTQYWWRGYAIDPLGTNLYSPASSIFSFTTNPAETRIIEGKLFGSTIY